MSIDQSPTAGGSVCPPDVLFAAALRGDHVDLLDDAARSRPLAAWRWARADASDHAVLAACTGATLDVGCGPGRMASELALAGSVALGIDVVPEAVAQTRARGAQALLRDVFDAVPGAGRWQTVLLADGNIGIGGDPVRLLRRAAELLVAGGRVVVDLAAPGFSGSVRTHRLAGSGMVSEPFSWAIVGTDEVAALAEAASLRVLRTRDHDGRWFGILEKPAVGGPR